jgi:hypothetical protein
MSATALAGTNQIPTTTTMSKRHLRRWSPRSPSLVIIVAVLLVVVWIDCSCCYAFPRKRSIDNTAATTTTAPGEGYSGRKRVILHKQQNNHQTPVVSFGDDDDNNNGDDPVHLTKTKSSQMSSELDGIAFKNVDRLFLETIALVAITALMVIGTAHLLVGSGFWDVVQSCF